MDSITYSRPMGPSKRLTEKQLAGYAKARATRAAKKTGTAVTVTVAAPKAKGSRKTKVMDSITYSRPMGPSKRPTEAQLAGLAKARATRAAKKAGTTVAVAVAAPTAEKKPRSRKTKVMDSITYSRPIGPRRKPTEVQLAALAKARAVRAANVQKKKSI